VAAKTGDHATITATVTNTTRQPVHGATLFLGLVDMTPGQPLPLGLEGWTSEPESRGLAPLVPGGSASATWDLVQLIRNNYSILGRQGRCRGHDLRNRFGGPVKRMCMVIPFFNELIELGAKLIFGCKIHNA
jgi:hypothetical protein